MSGDGDGDGDGDRDGGGAGRDCQTGTHGRFGVTE
jgi:hypothetical protein